MTQPLYEHHPTFAGYRTRALELEGDGPAILLIHGFADSADTWRLVLDRLAREGRRALAVDLPGFGTADPLAPGAILPQLDRFVVDAVQTLARDSGGPVVLGGNSLGGTVSLRVGERKAMPLHGVVPIGPAGLDMPRWFALIERDPIVRTLISSPIPIPSVVRRQLVGAVYRQMAFAHTTAVHTAVVRAFVSHIEDRRRLAGCLATGRTLLPELADAFHLAAVRVPVLLLWGDRDRMVSHSGSRWIIEALPDTRYELLEDCGHCPQIEMPDRVVDELLAFAPAAVRTA